MFQLSKTETLFWIWLSRSPLIEACACPVLTIVCPSGNIGKEVQRNFICFLVECTLCSLSVPKVSFKNLPITVFLQHPSWQFQCSVVWRLRHLTVPQTNSNPLCIDRYSQTVDRNELLALGIFLLGHHQHLEVSV